MTNMIIARIATSITAANAEYPAAKLIRNSGGKNIVANVARVMERTIELVLLNKLAPPPLGVTLLTKLYMRVKTVIHTIPLRNPANLASSPSRNLSENILARILNTLSRMLSWLDAATVVASSTTNSRLNINNAAFFFRINHAPFTGITTLRHFFVFIVFKGFLICSELSL